MSKVYKVFDFRLYDYTTFDWFFDLCEHTCLSAIVVFNFFDFALPFFYEIIDTEIYLFSFHEYLLVVKEIEEHQCRHPYIVLAIFLEFFQRFLVARFLIFFPEHFSLGSHIQCFAYIDERCT